MSPISCFASAKILSSSKSCTKELSGVLHQETGVQIWWWNSCGTVQIIRNVYAAQRRFRVAQTRLQKMKEMFRRDRRIFKILLKRDKTTVLFSLYHLHNAK